MSFAQFLAILFARRWLFLAVLLAVLLPALAVTLWLPKRYAASASVVVDVKPDPLSAFPTLANPTVMATQIDIVQSERVARRVVRNLKLLEAPQVRQQWMADTGGRGDLETWLVERFQKELSVKPSRESSVIEIAYTAADPQFAAGLANAFAQAYIDTVLELRVEPAKQYSSFFEARARDARAALGAAQSKLSAFQQHSGVVMTDERMDVETQRLNDLSSQLVAIQAAAADASSRQAQASAGSADKLQEISNHPVVAGLRGDLSRMEAKLQELSSRLGDGHPQVIELKANIAELRRRLDVEVRQLSAGVGISNSISRQREAQIRAELEAQRAKVLKMKQVRDEGMMILRDVETAQRAYDNITQRLSQSSLESQATATNVSLLNSAVPPLQAAFPRVGLNASLALFMGLLLATVATLLMELRDRRVRAPQDIEALLGLPVLGRLPAPGATSPASPLARLAGRAAPRLNAAASSAGKTV